MKLIKTIKKLVEEAEQRYNYACERGENEKIINKLEKDYYDSLKLMKKINVIEKNKKESD